MDFFIFGSLVLLISIHRLFCHSKKRVIFKQSNKYELKEHSMQRISFGLRLEVY